MGKPIALPLLVLFASVSLAQTLPVRQAYADCGFSKYVSLVSSPGQPSPSNLVAKLQCGQELRVVGRSGSWLEVKTQNNEHGYVSQWFVSEKPLAAIPNYDGPVPTKKEQKAARHRIGIGMTVEQVHAAWGLPDRVNMTYTAKGAQAQLVYRLFSFRQGWYNAYVYVEDGVVVAIQTD